MWRLSPGTPTPYISVMSGSYIIKPNPADPRLTERVSGIDQTGAKIDTSVR
jgi:hypothetical protein